MATTHTCKHCGKTFESGSGSMWSNKEYCQTCWQDGEVRSSMLQDEPKQDALNQHEVAASPLSVSSNTVPRTENTILESKWQTLETTSGIVVFVGGFTVLLAVGIFIYSFSFFDGSGAGKLSGMISLCFAFMIAILGILAVCLGQSIQVVMAIETNTRPEGRETQVISRQQHSPDPLGSNTARQAQLSEPPIKYVLQSPVKVARVHPKTLVRLDFMIKLRKGIKFGIVENSGLPEDEGVLIYADGNYLFGPSNILESSTEI